MTKDEVLEKADSESMKEAFSAWYKYDVNQDMDVHTEIAWKNWQIAWNAALAQLYTVPPQRKPLTDAQIDDLAETHCFGIVSVDDERYIFRTSDLRELIEAAHGIKD